MRSHSSGKNHSCEKCEDEHPTFLKNPDCLAELTFGDCMDEIANKIKVDILKESKLLKNKYKSLGITECYCNENSASECPKHIEDFIRGLEEFPKNK